LPLWEETLAELRLRQTAASTVAAQRNRAVLREHREDKALPAVLQNDGGDL
jgi:hypothetical protein